MKCAALPTEASAARYAAIIALWGRGQELMGVGRLRRHFHLVIRSFRIPHLDVLSYIAGEQDRFLQNRYDDLSEDVLRDVLDVISSIAIFPESHRSEGRSGRLATSRDPRNATLPARRRS
jgi:hypothetical protein